MLLSTHSQDKTAQPLKGATGVLETEQDVEASVRLHL